MRLNNLGRRLCTVSSLALAIAAAPAFAQEANSQASASDAGRSNIDNEIVVTAQKREQRLIDVPVAINTMSGDAIADRGITDLQQFSYAVPGLVLRYDGPGSSQVFLRGAANIRGSDAMVATYMDEVPVTLTGGFRQVDLRALLQRLAAVRGRLSLCADQAAAAKWWLSMPMASVSAEGPMPKALSTRRTSPLMPGCRHQGRACPLRRARMTSNPLIVA